MGTSNGSKRGYKKTTRTGNSLTMVDNHKNIPKYVVANLLKELDASKMAQGLCEMEADKRGVTFSEVRALAKELTKGHLSLARLKKHMTANIGDNPYDRIELVKDAFGAYFDIYMARSFQKNYVWNSEAVEKIRYLEFGVRYLSNLREPASISVSQWSHR